MTATIKTHTLVLLVGAGLCFISACEQTPAQEQKGLAETGQPVPLSDPDNEGGWLLNEDISDEFEGTEIDTSKWFVEGQNGDYYIWKGRPPSQFAPHNVLVEDGKLKIRTQWEPEFQFAQENYADGANNDRYGEWEGKPFPVTTGGVITKKRFLNGYIEAKTKTGNAAITGAFWGIGYEQELDIFEQMGNPKGEKLDIHANGTKITIHDWSPPAKRPTWVWKYKDNNLPFRTADEFHVFGVEWGVDYVKYFMDGDLVAEVSQDELGSEWVLNNPLEIWFDSEIFKWLGLPNKEELPVDFEIEYLRVWQQPNENLLDRAFYGFEGPILFEETPRPLTLLPESSVPDDYQKFWIMDTVSAQYFVINKGDYASGVNSLEFTGVGKGEKLETDKIVAVSPKGAVDLPAGDYLLSLKVYLEQGHMTEKLYLGFEEGPLEIPIELSGRARRKWLQIEQRISKPIASGSEDQLRIEIRKEDIPKDRAAKFYVDDIAIHKVSN